MLDLEVDELPGVGWNICQKLKELGIASVRDVRASTKDVLQREIGNKTGARRLFRILCVTFLTAYARFYVPD